MLENNGRHDWIRTSDLFRVKSRNGLIRKRLERIEATQRGSVHAGFTQVRCLLCVTKRHGEIQSDSGRDGRVMTQAMTQD
jgi:hypothetical protein